MPARPAIGGTDMRLKSAIWVSAYLRRVQAGGAFAAVRRRGNEDAGTIFIKINRLDGTAELFGPAPQSAADDGWPTDRAFMSCLKTFPALEEDSEAYLVKEIRFDPDVWIIEVEDRQGRNFLDDIVR